MKPRIGVSRLLVSSAAAYGQTLSRMIVGTVTDQTGAPGSQAKVSSINVGTQFAHTVETNEAR